MAALIPLLLGLIVLAGAGILIYALRTRRVARTLREQQAACELALEEQTRRIEEQGQELLQLEKAKNRFYSAVSQALRTPLTLILGPLKEELDAADETTEPTRLQRLRLIYRNALRLENRVDQLLVLSRIHLGDLKPRLAERDLVHFLHGIHASLVGEAERRRVKLDFKPWVEELNAYFDTDLLRKVVVSLVRSSLSTTPEGGRIRICIDRILENGSDLASVKIKDTGRGIAATDIPFILDQLTASDGMDPIALGFGLALARPILNQLGGTVKLESERGFGSTFTLRFPVRPANEQAVDQATEAPTTESARLPSDGEDELFLLDETDHVENENAPLVLLADDNVEMRYYLRTHLGQRYRLLEASNGNQALDLVRAFRPALVLSEVILPEMDGIHLCRAIKEDESLAYIPVVLLTARASGSGEFLGLMSGADDYVTKPFYMDALLARLENLIDLRRRLRENFSEKFVLSPSEVTVSSLEAEFLEEVKAVVEHHLEDSQFGVDWLADEVHLSTRQLHRRLQAIAGLTPAGMIRMLRLNRAAQLLDQHAGTVTDIAHRVGYRDVAHFSYVFHQVFGMAPSDYARNHHNG